MPHDGQTGIIVESDGYTLLGTLYLARGDDAKPTAIVLHGLPGIEKNVDVALGLRERGWNALIFHPRGFWGSEGVADFRAMPGDVRAALDVLSTHPQVDPGRLVLIGHSFGGWAAVLAAAADDRPKGVAIYGAVADPRRLHFTREVVAAEFTPWLPGLDEVGFAAQWASLDAAYAPVEQVGRIAPRPLLIIHSERDAVVPVEQAHRLRERAGQGAELLLHPEANHSFTWHRDWLRAEFWRWLDRLPMVR